MVDNTVTGEPPVASEEDLDELSNVPTLFLAFITLAIYLLFLKPTAGDGDDNTAANETAARGRQRQRGAARRPVPQHQQQHQPQAPRRRLQMSDNAIEVLETCRSHPPHVVPSSIPVGRRSIGGFELLSENGLVAFSHTVAAVASSASTTNTISPSPKSGDAPAAITMNRSTSSSSSNASVLLQRKERAKILSRLFAARETGSGKAPPSPPAKGSTFVIGVSKARHLADSRQRSSLVRVLKGLAAHYTVLVVVSPGDTATDSGYEATRTLHSEATSLLRDGGNDDDDDNESSGLSASVLPSHRILLAGTATGRVALVRQLSTNIGLTVDFDTDVREELERFGYEVSIVDDWKTILPAAVVSKPS